MTEAWTALTEGPGLVLAVDFEATGRPEASFLDLAPMLEPRREVWSAGQPPLGADVGMTAPDYLARWAAEPREPVHAILGFCAGACFAATLAERIGDRQDMPPRLVVLDPERPTAQTLRKQFDQAMKGMAGVATPDELGWAEETAAAVGDDLVGAADVLSKAYREIGDAAFGRIGLKPDYRADLIASFRSLMSYLVAAEGAYPTAGWSSATAIVSATPVCEPEGAATTIRLDVAHADLLRSTETAQAVSTLLASP